MDSLFYIVPAAAAIALFFAWFFFRQMMKESEGTITMKEIAKYVRDGAMAYLKQQYKVVTIVFVVLAIFFAILAYGFHIQNTWVPFAFSDRRIFLGTCRIYRNENCNLRFGTYCQCSFTFT